MQLVNFPSVRKFPCKIAKKEERRERNYCQSFRNKSDRIKYAIKKYNPKKSGNQITEDYFF